MFRMTLVLTEIKIVFPHLLGHFQVQLQRSGHQFPYVYFGRNAENGEGTLRMVRLRMLVNPHG